MALNKANISWSAKQITKMADNGTFSFDNIIQRSYVWETARKSNLIHSMIEGYPIPPFYAKKVDGKVYDFLDGKQRIDAIRGFIDNEYTLTGIPEVEYMDAEGNTKTMYINGKKFEELPEELQDAVKDYHLTIYYYEDITPEQVRMLFAKLNNGKPLSTKERNIANCVDIKTLADLGNHELFKKTFTEKALTTRKQLPIIMKIWMMLNYSPSVVSFASKDFNEVMQTTIMSNEEKEVIVSVLDKMYAVYQLLENNSIKKKLISETHLVSLAPFFQRAVEEDITDELMADFITEIFWDGLVSDAYAETCKGGSARTASIKCRDDELEKKWDEFFCEDESETEDDEEESDEGEDDDEVIEKVEGEIVDDVLISA